MIIECTKKLADAMKLSLNQYEPTMAGSFYEWHANIFLLNRKKGVLLMNNKTRYCIVLYGLKMEHFKKFDTIVLEAIKETFLEEGFSSATVDKYIMNCDKVSYSKTHDRSILGQMKEFDISISWKIEEYLPSDQLNLLELNKWIGNTLMCGPLDYVNPITLLKNEMRKLELFKVIK